MRNKLKILFGYFRGLGESVETYMNLEYSEIEDWQERFTTPDGKTEHEPPQSILDIVEEIVKKYVNKFHSKNDYTESDYWTLNITIYPYEKRINFQSECEVIIGHEYRRSDFTNLVSTLQLNNLKFQYFEIKDQELEKFKFGFSATWDETEISERRMNDEIIIYDDFDDTLADLTDDIMRIVEGAWWAQDPGAYGTITYSENQFYIHYWKREKDYERTELDFNITLDNIDE